MPKGNPRLGQCLCGSPATIRDTKAEDERLHFTCHGLTPEGRAKHWGFVDRSEAGRLEEGFRDIPGPEENDDDEFDAEI